MIDFFLVFDCFIWEDVVENIAFLEFSRTEGVLRYLSGKAGRETFERVFKIGVWYVV